MLNVADFFSGIGMFSYGLHQTKNYETGFFCEPDIDCQHHLKNNFWNSFSSLSSDKHPFIFQDIKKFGRKNAPVIEQYMFEIFQNYLTRNCIVVGGWPCTGYSIAGKKNGDENEDSALWKEFLRCIRLLEPNWVIAENSANIRSFNIEKIEKKYNEIGYAVEWHVIPSCSVGGVSRRERIYFIANRYGVRCFPETDATSEEKSKWWTEARALIGSKWPSQPEPSRMDLRNPTGLDEAIRRKRVQLCGMSLDPRIPFIIGARINAIECEINKKPRREGVVYV